MAIYRFARTADDIADEGDASARDRLKELAAYRADLEAVAMGRAPSSRWAAVFEPLAAMISEWRLPLSPLHDLLDAFAQDAGNPVYVDRAELLGYCRRSANPVGRLLLHLYGIGDSESLRRSDCICTALQLINFWQDLSVDTPRGRHYMPLSDLAAHGLKLEDIRAQRDGARTQAMVAELCRWAEGMMLDGAPLALRVPGRAGLELRLVVQGGLRILERIRVMHHASLRRRPKLGLADLPALLWRAWRMGRKGQQGYRGHAAR